MFMENLSSLIGQLITILCIAALLEQLLPRGGATVRYVRSFTGLFILLSLLQPLTLSFNIWEQSLSQLAAESPALAEGEKNEDLSSLPPDVLSQRIRLPSTAFRGLAVREGYEIRSIELWLENQKLAAVQIEVALTDESRQADPWTEEDKKNLINSLAETLGVSLRPEQISWLFI